MITNKEKMKVLCRLVWLVLPLVFGSCATASLSRYGAVGRVKQYDFYSEQLPSSFEGFRMAFVSDLHYESRFSSSRLPALVRTLQSLQADVLLLGGDYRGRNGGNIDELFGALAQVKTPYGTYAVMGNHERGEAEVMVRKAMARTGVHLLEHRTDSLWRGDEFLSVCGVRNPFDLKKNGVSPSLALSPTDFVVMLVHTPDYVEDVDVTNTDLALAGHTHGGQVSLFGKWSPAHYSKYGNRFMTGLKYNSKGIPVIVTNGVGTSRKDFRLFTPSEVVVIVLHKGSRRK